ncbi:MAG TPA: zinc-dependent metalloprotease, partial [Bacteroidia bacterium]|nr:zinc-dependent metalloprotease [Bacteroidia bacterium]
MIHTLTQKRVSFIFLFFVLAQLHPVFGQHQSVLNSAASASQSASLNASQSGQQVLFSSIRNPEAQSILDTYGQGIVLLEPDWNKVNSILEAKPLVLELALTLPDGSAVIAELRQVNLFGGEPETGQYNMSGKSLVKYTPGVYYRGSVKGLPKSVVSFSFFIHSLSGFVSLPSAGNIVIAPVKDILPGLSGKYVLYDDQKLFIKNSFTCNAVEQNEIKNQLGNQFRNRIGVGGGNCVRVYFECDYQLYLDHGSDVAAATNFVTAIFNEVATLYSNEAVSTIISAIFIWTSPDPYMTYTTSGDCLTGFQSVRTTYNGDIAHLLSTRSINVGGVAWLDVLCNSAYSYAYSNIYNSYASFPTYSWTVMVIAHEIGHNLGSNHTQWCGWTGGALDNCYTTEGGCAPGPAPATGGTIMSYCHLTGYGINFANGFGQQPGDAIRSRVSSAGCLSSCSCFPDVVIFAAPYSTICTGATVTFTATPTNGGTGPVYQWKKNGLVVGTNNPVYSTSSLANGDEIICEMTSNDPCAGGVTISSNAIIMSVNSNVTPSITISTGSTTICQGELATFGAIFNNGGSEPSFQWKVNGVNAGFDASSFSTSTLNNGDVVSCTLF